MSTSAQGTSGPGGRAGFHPAIRERPVRGHHAAPELMLTQFEQISTEQSISSEVRKLIVRMFTNVFNFGP